MRKLGWGVWIGFLVLAQCAHGVSKQEEASQLASEMAEIMVAHHANDAAVPLVQRGLAEDPNNPRMHTLMGILLRDRGLFSEARRELERAYQMQPNDLDTVVAMGVLLDMSGDGNTAEVWHQRALSMNSERAELYNNLGFSYYLRHEDAKAVKAYREALAHNPSAQRVYNNLGFALARLGKYAEALAAFERSGNKGSALANLGVAYELAGDLQTARSFYEQALQTDKSLKTARANLENVMARLADTPVSGQTPAKEMP